MDKKKILAENIRQFRIRLHWSQRELAERVGVTSASISYYEEERTYPRTRVLERIVRLFGLESVQVLVERKISEDFPIDRLLAVKETRKDDPKNSVKQAAAIVPGKTYGLWEFPDNITFSYEGQHYKTMTYPRFNVINPLGKKRPCYNTSKGIMEDLRFGIQVVAE
jgi:transcriptional regulator with XRE-family HTH domain